MMLLLNLVSVARLERNPTVKEEIRLRGFERDIPAGFLTYPVSQAADITAFRAELVPVGVDQVPMLEQTNELVGRFNALVGRSMLEECRAVLSTAPRLPGIDGKHKMSKSLGNGVALSAGPNAIREAVQRMYTDPKQLRVDEPGRTEGNVAFAFLDAFDPEAAELEELKAHYRRGGLADRVVKQRLDARLQALLAPIRERRIELAADPFRVLALLDEGTRRARERAAATLADVRKALCLAGSNVAAGGGGFLRSTTTISLSATNVGISSARTPRRPRRSLPERMLTRHKAVRKSPSASASRTTGSTSIDRPIQL